LPGQHSAAPPDGLMRDILRSARRRWGVLVLGLALLAVLFVFAGMTRTPGARKNPYTVIASRVLAVVGAALLARIVLLTHEGGVPVLFVAAGAGGVRLADWLGLIERRFEVVPLSDVVAYIREERYVPRKGVAVVIAANGAADLAVVNAALVEGEGSGRIPVTLLLGEALAAGVAAGAAKARFPEGAALGVRVGAGGAGGEGRWDEGRALDRVKSAAAALGAAGGMAPTYAMLEGEEEMDAASIAKGAGLLALFGGDGLNRYGDRGNRIRLMDVAPVLAGRRARGIRLSAYASMYRGSYLPYPVWLWLELTAPLPRGGEA
jgi:hypothetical protein